MLWQVNFPALSFANVPVHRIYTLHSPTLLFILTQANSVETTSGTEMRASGGRIGNMCVPLCMFPCVRSHLCVFPCAFSLVRVSPYASCVFPCICSLLCVPLCMFPSIYSFECVYCLPLSVFLCTCSLVRVT